ncbi:MAG: hypothetical protein ACFFDQ_12105 [Candidatus Thorarchaeota archaeon]
MQDGSLQSVSAVHGSPNSPELSSKWLENPSDRGGLVCMENDFAQGRYISMKNMSGLADLIKFDMVWGLP